MKTMRLYMYQRSILPTAALLLALVNPNTADGGVSPLLAGQVDVSGNRLFRDGVAWTPHGVVTIAYVAPPAAQEGVFLAAYKHATSEQLTAIKAWGADTIRMQVSQPGLDPESPIFTMSFLNAVKDEVLAARNANLNVIVSVQDEL